MDLVVSRVLLATLPRLLRAQRPSLEGHNTARKYRDLLFVWRLFPGSVRTTSTPALFAVDLGVLEVCGDCAVIPNDVIQQKPGNFTVCATGLYVPA